MKPENSQFSQLDLICGYHRYILSDAFQLDFASGNLCRMCECSKEAFYKDGANFYLSLIKAEDREKYSEFLKALSEKPCEESLTYRIITSQNRTIFVKDTSVSHLSDDGVMLCESVLCDISDIAEENNSLRLFDDRIPLGLLRYTNEKNPKVTYINDKMKKILRFPERRDGELDYLDFYSQNMFLMLPFEEQRRFSRFLCKVSSREAPVSGEITVMRCDGTKARLYGWASKIQGTEEFQSVCMDITEGYMAKREAETERYLDALINVYDRIFRYDFTTKTVKYVHSSQSDSYSHLLGVPMQLEEATEMWIRQGVLEKDRKKVRDYFDSLFCMPYPKSSSQQALISFQTISDSGEISGNSGIFLKIGQGVGLFCIKKISGENENENLLSENQKLRSLNRNMNELVMRFTDGIVAFELSGNLVKPLYASDNVRKFFGYGKEEWLEMAEKGSPLTEFVSRSGVDISAFSELLDSGEAQFTYNDIKTGEKKKVKAICSQKSADSPRYVMLYNNKDSKKEVKSSPKASKVSIRTFGYFDVFVKDKPIVFRNRKSKELLALLVDRRGGYVSSEEAISFLWEDEPANAVTLARYRKVALRLKNILEEYGIREIVESVDGKRRIVTDKVSCDLFDYLSGKEEYKALFKGSYLTNYSWGETMLGELTGKQL